jgi:hypothetical protein
MQVITRQQVINTLQYTTDKLAKTLDAKGQDYSGKEDTYKNFKSSAEMLNIPVEKAIMVRLLDKVTRISNLLDNDAKVKSESIIDTLDDLVGYTILLKTWMIENSFEEVKKMMDEVDEEPTKEAKDNLRKKVNANQNKVTSEDLFNSIMNDEQIMSNDMLKVILNDPNAGIIIIDDDGEID